MEKDQPVLAENKMKHHLIDEALGSLCEGIKILELLIIKLSLTNNELALKEDSPNTGSLTLEHVLNNTPKTLYEYRARIDKCVDEMTRILIEPST